MVPIGAKYELKASVDERIDALAALKKATVTTVASRDATKLLIGYVDALAPYAARAGSYGGNPNLNTLAYGGSAERALACRGGDDGEPGGFVRQGQCAERVHAAAG
jgi:hypothetical protein